MASDVSKVSEAFDIHGRSVEVGHDEDAVYLNFYGKRLLFEAREREQFMKAWVEAERRAEAYAEIARAVPGAGDRG